MSADVHPLDLIELPVVRDACARHGVALHDAQADGGEPAPAARPSQRRWWRLARRSERNPRP